MAVPVEAVVSGVPFSFSFFGSRSNSSRSWGRSRASSRAWRSQSRVLEFLVGFLLDDRADEDQLTGAALPFGGGNGVPTVTEQNRTLRAALGTA